MEQAPVKIFGALSDETRFRILMVLSHGPLSVNELLDVLEMGQSRVSRHLKILTDAGLLEKQREGARVFYGLRVDTSHRAFLAGLLPEKDYTPAFLSSPPYKRDQQRLIAIMEERKKQTIEHFQNYGPEDDVQMENGLVDADFYRQEILSLVEDGDLVADLGCGTGDLSVLLSAKAGRVICVDQSMTMLEQAAQKLQGREAEFRLGSLEYLPLKDREVDTVIMSMVLHHMPEPLSALKEAARVLNPDGSLILADLLHHEEEVMRDRFADFWLGFRRERLETMLSEAGFEIFSVSEGKGKSKLNCLFFVARPSGRQTYSKISEERRSVVTV